MSENPQFDLIVIGAGPAGLTAGMYGAWLGLKTLILETGIVGGRAWMAPRIENYPGLEDPVTGAELTEKMRAQALRFGAEIKTDEEVSGLELITSAKKVISRKSTYNAQAVIICTGTQRRKLRVPGEAEFLGRGVSYCPVCDGFFFKKATVSIIGNSEEAAIDALHMADIADKVSIITEEKAFVQGELYNRLKSKPNIEVLNGKVSAILGKQAVEAIKILDFSQNTEVELPVKGVFVSLGGVPMTEIVKKAGLATDQKSCLTVDRQQKTSIEGVYAAGDCTCGGMQVVTAAGEGAMAALNASKLIRKTKT